jgi:hypothetical protein
VNIFVFMADNIIKQRYVSIYTPKINALYLSTRWNFPLDYEDKSAEEEIQLWSNDLALKNRNRSNEAVLETF